MTDPYMAKHYGERAQDYVASTVHSQGADLEAIDRLVLGQSIPRALDLGCGGGHVTYRLAPLVGEVVACDVTGPMLEAVAQEAGKRGLANVKTTQAAAEELPFEDGSFDAVFARFTTHHWSNAIAGLQEARRVMSSATGRGMFIDVTAPPAALLDSWLQTVELLRDVSHVRDYTLAEWTTLMGQAGFVVQGIQSHRLRMEFTSWVARTQTPPEQVAALRSLQRSAPEEVIRYFEIEADGCFTIDVTAFQVAPLGRP